MDLTKTIEKNKKRRNLRLRERYKKLKEAGYSAAEAAIISHKKESIYLHFLKNRKEVKCED